MDIHKPRPWHNGREFLKEVGTIVLSILIALSLEQAVETWREHRQYRQAREAMRAELGGNVANLARLKVISPCTGKRIAEISAILDKAERHEGFVPPVWIGEGSSSRLRYAAENEVARSGLFSPAEQRAFNGIYSYFHSIELEQDRERQVWARLQQLEGRTNVPPEMMANLRQGLAEARFQDERVMRLLGFVNLYARELSLTVTPLDPKLMPQMWPMCVPIDTPREEAMRLIAYPTAQ